MPSCGMAPITTMTVARATIMIRLCRTCVVATGTLEAQDSPMRLVRIYVKCVQGYTDL